MIRAAAICAVLASPAAAVTVEDCDWRASAATVMEPWEENTRTFANGRIRVALLDNIEPAAGPFHLLVLSPPFDELGGRQCKIVSYDGSMGFANVWFTDMVPTYDPAKGLSLDIPVYFWLSDENFSNSAMLTLTINQSSGAINTEFVPGGNE